MPQRLFYDVYVYTISYGCCCKSVSSSIERDIFLYFQKIKNFFKLFIVIANNIVFPIFYPIIINTAYEYSRTVILT